MTTLAQPPRLSSRARKATTLAMLVHGIDNPVDARIVANLLVAGIDENNLVVLHGCVLVDPVGVEHAQVGIDASDLLLGHALEVAFEFKVVDTLMLGFAKDHAAVVLLLRPPRRTPHRTTT